MTGASGGLGYQVALALASQQCTVILACRDLVKAEEAARQIRRLRPSADLECLEIDLARFLSVKRFVGMFKLRCSKLDYLVLNAGVYQTRYSLTEDGLEEMMQVNFLSNFYLSHLLLPWLVRTDTSRVVTMTSESHRQDIDFLFISESQGVH